MDIMEIFLLIAGGIIFGLSFFIPDRKGTSGEALSAEDIRELVGRELAAMRKSVNEATDESVTYAMEKTERSLERLSNEKIMAVSEYSDTVLTEIRKNHEEVMFLYDMLNNKHTSLKNTVADVNRAVKEAEEAVAALKRQAAETAEPVRVTQAHLPSEQGKAVQDTEQKQAEEPILESGAVPGTEDVQANAESGSNKERIISLYRQGKAVADIARELELGVGEVKLVIDLFQESRK